MTETVYELSQTQEKKVPADGFGEGLPIIRRKSLRGPHGSEIRDESSGGWVGTGWTHFQSSSSTARNASCGTSTWPIAFIRFLPSACLFQSFRLRLMSPP